jgi:hypothetical protein
MSVDKPAIVITYLAFVAVAISVLIAAWFYVQELFWPLLAAAVAVQWAGLAALTDGRKGTVGSAGAQTCDGVPASRPAIATGVVDFPGQ